MGAESGLWRGRQCLPWLLPLLWLCALASLTIAPVWDEIGAMDVVRQATRLPALLAYLWTDFPLYRPLGTSTLAVVLFTLPFDWAWPVLRFLNAALVLAAFALLADAAQRLQGAHGQPAPDASMRALYWAAVCLSPAALIVGGWYANIFDALCLALAALGLALLGRNRFVLAGLAFGLAWFSKEAALFIAPLLVYLYLRFPRQRRGLYWAAAIYLLLGAAYWLLRSRAVALGSAQDVHALTLGGVWPALCGYFIRLWMPGVTPLPALLGVGISLAVMLASRDRTFMALVLMLAGAAAVAYTGMVHGVAIGTATPVVSAVVFDARLFYIPAGLLLFALLLSGRRLPLGLALLGLASGLPSQYQRQRDLQQTYLGYYRLGEQTPGGITIHAPVATTGVQVAPAYRGVRIGDYPQASHVLNPWDGRLQTQPSALPGSPR